MLRKLIASLITIYAIAFAFGALAAVRWPSIMMAVSWMVQDDIAGGLESVDWRALGIAYGAPYLLAALCFYCSAAMIAGRRPGSVLWYVMGLFAGFPTVYLVSFEDGWWPNPEVAIIRPRPTPAKPIFVPAAIARQRASFAAHGRRMNAKRNQTRSIRLF